MKKYILLIIIIGFVVLVSSASIELSNEGRETGRIINLDKVIEVIKTFLGLDDVLETTYSGNGGLCVQVNPGETGLIFGNCSNATGGSSGDISAVNAIGPYILEGGVTGSVNISFNETILNLTIDDRAITTETDPIFSSNFTNMQVDCPTGNYTYGIEGNGTLKCRDDLQGAGGSGELNNDGLFVNYTLTKTTGNITNGSLVGYTAADNICNVEVASDSHMCQAFEIINSVRIKGFNNFTATFRISEAAPGFTANANDCIGWRDDTSSNLGSIWVGNNINGGQGALVACNAERAIACCL